MAAARTASATNNDISLLDDDDASRKQSFSVITDCYLSERVWVWVNRVSRPTRHVIGHFGDVVFPAGDRLALVLEHQN